MVHIHVASKTLHMPRVRPPSQSQEFLCISAGCGKIFCERGGLKRHSVTHTVARPHACDYPVCGKTFKLSDKLTLHKRIMHSDHTFVCSFDGCGKTFALDVSLQTHVRSHNNIYRFKCEFDGCDSTFSERGALKRHAYTHGGMRPMFPCEECGVTFVAKQKLDAHVAIHTPQGVQMRKKAEQRVASLLENAGIPDKREHIIDFACVDSGSSRSFARVDFVIINAGRVIFLEVDEKQHISYPISCDVARMARIYESLFIGGNTLPVSFIRYNHDAYTVGNVDVRTPKVDRETRLLQILTQQSSDGLSIMYLYYDCDVLQDGTHSVCVHKDNDYDPTMKACCLLPVI